MTAEDMTDSPEAIAKGQRYLAWSAGAAACFVVAATISVHVAHEKPERALQRQNRDIAFALGSDISRQFPVTP